MTGGVVTKLNLGAGNRILANHINHDLSQHRPEIDVAHDLNDLPWPWTDNSLDVIEARSVLEHLHLSLVESMNECWRVLRPEGRVLVKLPYWAHEVSFRDPTHRWLFTLDTLRYFDPTTELGQEYGFYTDRKWRIVDGPKLNPQGSSLMCTLVKVA